MDVHWTGKSVAANVHQTASLTITAHSLTVIQGNVGDVSFPRTQQLTRTGI